MGELVPSSNYRTGHSVYMFYIHSDTDRVERGGGGGYLIFTHLTRLMYAVVLYLVLVGACGESYVQLSVK